MDEGYDPAFAGKTVVYEDADSKWVEIYPSEDLDGNGVIDSCVPGWATV